MSKAVQHVGGLQEWVSCALGHAFCKKKAFLVLFTYGTIFFSGKSLK